KNDAIFEVKSTTDLREINITKFMYELNNFGQDDLTDKNLKGKLTSTIQFYGKWNSYSDSGVLVKYYYYSKGELVKTEYVDKNNTTNDSLIKALITIDQEFAGRNILVDSVNANLKNVISYRKFKNELRSKDSVSFAAIEVIISRYGYPSPKIAGDVYGVPFFILGFAPLSIKEKYLNDLIFAADRGYLEWSSLAFYIDKVKVAKGEKQIYGTQGSYDKNDEYIYYPIEDPENVNKRRQKVGLDEL
ncbi:MAG: DUF6624 domain-containing protein, partial [Bacteroidota bacterium]